MNIDPTISTQEDALFSVWRLSRPALVADGVVHEATFKNSSPRLLFVLKEANDPNGGGWDLREFLRSEDRHATWYDLARWVDGIRSEAILSWDEIETMAADRRTAALRSIAAVNLKKTPGGHTSDPNVVNRHAREDEGFLRQQFNLYKPNLVICCGSGTGDIYKSIMDPDNAFEWSRTKRGIRFYIGATGTPVLGFNHPEARIPAHFLHYALLDAVEELRNVILRTT